MGILRKIVLVIDSYPPRPGGMETHAFEFARFLLRQNTYEFKGVIAFSDVAVSEPLNSNIFPVSPMMLPERALYDAGTLINRLEQLSIGPHDIVFFNSLYWIRLLPALHQHFPETFFVQRSGGNDIVQAPIQGAGENLSERQSFVCDTLNETLSLLIVTSEYSLNRLANTGINPALMRAVVGGVDLDRFKPVARAERDQLRAVLNIPRESYVILDVSRFVPFKGIEYGLRAMATMKGKLLNGKEWQYILVGGGAMKGEFQSLAEELGIHKNVIFVGEIDPGMVHQYYQAADLFCHSPIEYEQSVQGGSYIHTESMGRCLIEATACGLPIVVTDVGGIREIVQEGENGLVVPARSIKEISDAIESIADNRELAASMSEKGRMRAEELFSWKDMFDQYFSLFNFLI